MELNPDKSAYDNTGAHKTFKRDDCVNTNMTKLTLQWHLRAITNGVPENAFSTDVGQNAPQNGFVCDAFPTRLARLALESEDSVKYLDTVAHDPSIPFNWRASAEQLLSSHVMERRTLPNNVTRDTQVQEEFTKSQFKGELPQQSMQSDYWWGARCPNCLKGTTVYDEETETAHCECGNLLGMKPLR